MRRFQGVPSLLGLVLHPLTGTLHQSQPRAVHQAGYAPLVAGQVPEDGFHFRSGEDDGKPLRSPRPDHVSQVPDLSAEDVTVQEEQRAGRLILRRRTRPLLHGQICQEGVDLGFSHLGRVADVVEEKMKRLTQWRYVCSVRRL